MSDPPQAQASPQLQQFILQEQAKAQVGWAPDPAGSGLAGEPALLITGRHLVRLQLQQTVSRLTEECWDKCISSPGQAMSFARCCSLSAPAARRPPAWCPPAPALLARLVHSSAGNYLSSREQACLDNCARRFLDTTQFVVKYFQAKAGGGNSGDDAFR